MKDKRITPPKERKPSHTKGYYTFRKDYPQTDNTDSTFAVKPAKLSIKTKIIIGIFAIIIFMLSFISASVIMNLSKREPMENIVGIELTTNLGDIIPTDKVTAHQIDVQTTGDDSANMPTPPTATDPNAQG